MALLMKRNVVSIEAAPPPAIAPPAGTTAPATTPPAGTPAPGAAAQSTGPDTVWVVLAFCGVILGALATWGIFEWRDPKVFVAAAGLSVFAPMYVIAQAIERILEPFTKYLGAVKTTPPATTAPGATPPAGTAPPVVRANQEMAKAKVEEFIAVGDLLTAVHWQAVLDRIRGNTTVIAWGIASIAAMLLSGWFGFRLLHATGLDAPGGIDVVITGLAIGSGTKPLHDLITNLQKAKDAKSDAPESATTA